MNPRLYAAVLGFLLLSLSGCDRTEAAQTKDITPSLLAWQKSNGHLIGALTLKLRNGGCLDLRRLSVPWTAQSNVPSQTLLMSADGDAVGIKPYERAGFSTTFEGEPHDGKIRVSITGWSSPPAGYYWRVASPEIIKANIADGTFRRLKTVGKNGSMAAFSAPGGRTVHIDGRYLNQCDVAADAGGPIRCTAVSSDQQYMFAFDMDQSDQGVLDQKIAQIFSLIEHTRTSCQSRE